MFAECVINIEAPLESTFHYHIPKDLEDTLGVGHLVEVEFGSRNAQAIVISLTTVSEFPDTKPVIGLIDPDPVVYIWQIELARELSKEYLAPLNGCLRLMLPPGITRWSDITVGIHPYWDGTGRLTVLQKELIDLLREKRDLRGNQIKRLLPKTEWKTAVNQLVRRNILVKGSILDTPRMKPKEIRTVLLVGDNEAIAAAATQFGRNNKESAVLIHLLNDDDPIPSVASVIDATGVNKPVIQSLADKQFITFVDDDAITPEYDLPPSLALAVSPKDAVEAIYTLRGATKLFAILSYLQAENRALSISDIYRETKSNLSHLKRLDKAGLIEFRKEEVWRDPMADRDFMPVDAPDLTLDQTKVWGRVKVSMMMADEQLQKPILLHGVTGSGKTEIYMRAIEYALNEGKQAIVLVPEIALTGQTVRRFAARFPDKVGVVHSRLSDGERYDTWRRARAGEIDIMIGPRSALFSPLPNLGIVIVDEEHDTSYKQTPPVPPPYYHTRETAVFLAKINNATVILGSATPDIVTYHRAQAGTYNLLELPKRVMGHRERIEGQADRLNIQTTYAEMKEADDAMTIPLPPVQIIDLRQELRAGNRTMFSRELQSAVDDVLERGEQAILFLNKRGTASFVICRDCGYVQDCPRCDLPMTYHRPRRLMSCHHCGRHEMPLDQCPTCESKRIRYFGAGTEQLEEQVIKRWPQARTVRWDTDTTGGKNKHEELLESFINHESDILIGTQMIAKGLDMPLVTLVGVISADVSLGLPDYATGERTFQTLAQVAGRAGRGLLGGRVIIQTYQPEHYAIQAAAEHDYTSFYLQEINFRTQHELPPYRRMANLITTDPVSARAERNAKQLAANLRNYIHENRLSGTEILGPMPPFFSRIDGRYRWQVVLRSPNPRNLLADFPIPKNWQIDIDPVSTL